MPLVSPTRKRLLFLAAVLLATAAGALVGVTLTPAPPVRAPNVRGPVATPPLERLVLTSPYGRRGLGWHTGVDLRARTGTPLAAVGAGVVEKAHTTPRGGKSVVVRLDDGWRVGYAHLSRIDVQEGARVAPGARVGLAGATGRASGPHLHFELRDPRSRRLVDPWPHLAHHASPLSIVSTARLERTLDVARREATRTLANVTHEARTVDVATLTRQARRDVERSARRSATLVRRTVARAVS